jgi:predicted RNase H-like nuclease (RuvC/YqgF family)
MSEREKIAEEIHKIYEPHDKECSYRDKDLIVATKIEQLHTKIQELEEELEEVEKMNYPMAIVELRQIIAIGDKKADALQSTLTEKEKENKHLRGALDEHGSHPRTVVIGGVY